MAGIKGNFKFYFDRKVGNEYRIPFKTCIDHLGNNDGLRYCIESQIGIELKVIDYTVDDRVYLQFKVELDADQTTLLNNIVNNHKMKTSYSDIELEAISWATSDNPVRDILPVIESNLTALYNASTWSNLSYVEKRIMAYWRVCTQQEALEVFTHDELDSFRWYSMYKYLDPKLTENMTHSDIRKAPTTYDFTKDFKQLYKKGKPNMTKGRPVFVEYYANYNTSTFAYSERFARIDFEFIDDPTNLILQRKALLSWSYNTDEIDNVNVKDIGRFYHPSEDISLRLEEAKQKRENIKNTLIMETAFFINATEGLNDMVIAQAMGVIFLDQYETEFRRWIDYGSLKQADLLSAISSADVNTHGWIDNDITAYTGVPGLTIRNYILSTLTL